MENIDASPLACTSGTLQEVTQEYPGIPRALLCEPTNYYAYDARLWGNGLDWDASHDVHAMSLAKVRGWGKNTCT